jgi:hypothetical protein
MEWINVAIACYQGALDATDGGVAMLHEADGDYALHARINLSQSGSDRRQGRCGRSDERERNLARILERPLARRAGGTSSRRRPEPWAVITDN